jgi:hypothetical protein
MTTNLELDSLAKELQIPHYVNARMKDELSNKTVADYECGIINLENSNQLGSHWIMYYKTPESERSPEICIGYSSYGDPLPDELKNYLGDKIYTSDIQIQDFQSKACGYYCLAILFLLSKGVKFEDIILGFRSGSGS